MQRADTAFHDGARGGAAPGADRALALLGAGADPEPSARRLLELVFALRPASYLRRMPGRETFCWPAGGPLVVKRYAGDEARDRWYERLARRRAPRSPGRREFENLAALDRDGLRVPRALLWVEEEGDARARSAVVMARVADAQGLGARLAGAPAPERAARLAALAELVARLHAQGWYHRDLYLHQVLVEPAGGLVLIDVGRARRERAPRRRWHVKDLAALAASAPATVSRAGRLRFLARYLERRGAPASDRRAWARAVARKAARIRAHVPRHVDPESVA